MPKKYYQAVITPSGTSLGALTSNGSNIGVSTTNPMYTLDVNGQIFTKGGVITASDISIKKNIQDVTGALDTVQKLRGVWYTLKTDTDTDTDTLEHKRELGVIAQEVRDVLPEVTYDVGDGVLGVKYEQMLGVLIEAIKELTTKYSELENRIKEVQSEIK